MPLPSTGTNCTSVAPTLQLPLGTYELTFVPWTSTDNEPPGRHEPGGRGGGGGGGVGPLMPQAQIPVPEPLAMRPSQAFCKSASSAGSGGALSKCSTDAPFTAAAGMLPGSISSSCV